MTNESVTPRLGTCAALRLPSAATWPLKLEGAVLRECVGTPPYPAAGPRH